MELNRNHYFAAGVLCVLIGVQLRTFDSFVLNEKASAYIAEQFSDGPTVATAGPWKPSLMPATPQGKRTVQIPRWSGLLMYSVGAVLLLHSLAMPKPGGG